MATFERFRLALIDINFIARGKPYGVGFQELVSQLFDARLQRVRLSFRARRIPYLQKLD